MGDDTMKIVVLDDDPDISFLIHTLLKRHGYWVSAWTNPERAMAEESTWREANLAVIDYDLKRGTTGADVIKWARQEAGFDGRVIMITGSASWDNRDEDEIEEHVDVVIAKVFEIDEFLSAVEDLAGG